MTLIICNDVYKSVTIPLGAGLYAGGCYLSRFIPQALVAGLFNKAPTALVRLVARITTTLGRGVHVVGAIAFIVAVHQIASRCSLKHAVQSGFRHYLQAADDSAQRNEALEGLPWDLMQMLPIKDVQAMLMGVNVTIKGNSAPLINSLSRVLWFKIAGLLEAEGTLEGKMPFLRWLLSGNEEDQKLVMTLSEGSQYPWYLIAKYRRWVLDLMDVSGNDAMVAKLLTWITGVSFKAADEGLATTVDRANAYMKQLGELDKQGQWECAELFLEKGARLSVLQQSLQENLTDDRTASQIKKDFEIFVCWQVKNQIEYAFPGQRNRDNVTNVTIDKARLDLAWEMLKDTHVKALPETVYRLLPLVKFLLEKEQWVLAAWLMGRDPLEPGTMKPLPFSGWTSENCKNRIYECWSAQQTGGSLLEAEFLMAILLAKQPLPLFDSQEAAAQHRARCLNTLSMASSGLRLEQLTAAIEQLYPEGTKEALGEYLLGTIGKRNEGTQSSFITALIRAGATPPPLGACQDLNLLEVVKHLAESNGTNDVLTWLTQLDFTVCTDADHIKNRRDIVLIQACVKAMENKKSQDDVADPLHENLMDLCCLLIGVCDVWFEKLINRLEIKMDDTRGEQVGILRRELSIHALNKTVSLGRSTPAYYTRTLKLVLWNELAVCKDVFNCTDPLFLMSVRLPNGAALQGHSILTYLLQNGTTDQVRLFITALENYIEREKDNKEDAISNVQKFVDLPAEGDKANSPVDYLMTFFSNDSSERKARVGHNLLFKLHGLGARIPDGLTLDRNFDTFKVQNPHLFSSESAT